MANKQTKKTSTPPLTQLAQSPRRQAKAAATIPLLGQSSRESYVAKNRAMLQLSTFSIYGPSFCHVIRGTFHLMGGCEEVEWGVFFFWVSEWDEMVWWKWVWYWYWIYEQIMRELVVVPCWCIFICMYVCMYAMFLHGRSRHLQKNRFVEYLLKQRRSFLIFVFGSWSVSWIFFFILIGSSSILWEVRALDHHRKLIHHGFFQYHFPSLVSLLHRLRSFLHRVSSTAGWFVSSARFSVGISMYVYLSMLGIISFIPLSSNSMRVLLFFTQFLTFSPRRKHQYHREPYSLPYYFLPHQPWLASCMDICIHQPWYVSSLDLPPLHLSYTSSNLLTTPSKSPNSI